MTARPAPLLLAATVVAGAAVCATDGFGAWPGLNDAVRPLLDLDKTMLGAGRMAHALSLAYCAYALGVAKLLQGLWFHEALCLVGQNGLAMFGLGSILSAIGQVIAETYGHAPLLDLGLVGGGLAAMVGAARVLGRRAAPRALVHAPGAAGR